MIKKAVVMGMPATINIVDKDALSKDIKEVFAYFGSIDDQFSPYKKDSELSKINSGELTEQQYSPLMKKILELCDKTKAETNGYFDINKDGKIDPSGLVKGFAINNSAKILINKGYRNFLVEIAGDIQVSGVNDQNEPWKIGIENPFNRKEIIKVLKVSNQGIATSGTYIRGQHIYDPINKKEADEIASITVIGPNVLDADRFATAAFAMGKQGIRFIDQLPGFEGYMVTKDKQGIATTGLDKYL